MARYKRESPIYLSGDQLARGREVMGVVRVGGKGLVLLDLLCWLKSVNMEHVSW